MFSQSVIRSVGLSVGWSVRRSAGQSVSPSVRPLIFSSSVSQSVVQSVCLSVGRSVVWHLSPWQLFPRHLSPWKSVPPDNCPPDRNISIMKNRQYKPLKLNSLQCPQWSLPRKGNPLSMNLRNDRTLNPIASYTLDFIQCRLHLAFQFYTFHLMYCILYIIS